MLKDKIIQVILFLFGIKKKEENVKNYRPTVTVMIPAFNEQEFILETINNLKDQTYPIQEIMVVDDHSSDFTGALARVYGAKVLRTFENTGAKARAQNYGIDFLTTDVVVMVDADTFLHPKAIEYIIPYLADGKTLSACGFVIPQETGSFWEKARLVEYLYGIGLFKRAQEHLSIPLVSSGCFSAFNVKLLREIGKFPEGNIAEDMMLTWTAHIKKKYKVKFVPEAISYPKEPASWKQFKGQALRWYRGFFQCISMTKKDLPKNFRLSFFIFFYLIMGMLSMFFLTAFLYSIIKGISLGSSILGITSFMWVVFVLIELAIGLGAVAYNGKKCGCMKKGLKYYPYLYIISFINYGLFLYALYMEWIKGKKLDYWEKGH
ncbi:glycosyltransferase family 2 protein [Candidatus Parcubacteria bacterium]|nr:glycosyltransferase family 2 protein [Candidatus Parcubacteria bacterium]